MNDGEILELRLAKEVPGRWSATLDAPNGAVVIGFMDVGPEGVNCRVWGSGRNVATMNTLRTDLVELWFERQGFPGSPGPWTRHSGDAAAVHVYVIKGDGVDRWKIGRAASPERRLLDLSTGSPVPLTVEWSAPETPEVNERTLHERFAHLRTHGEWFDLSSVLDGRSVAEVFGEIR